MSKHGLRGILDTLFPSGEGKKKTSEMIERGLDALRAARDARGFITGSNLLVPSRLELRLPVMRFDELAEIGAVRDIEYYFNDELMKDLALGKMKTFGDHPVYITIAADDSLEPNEIYAAVLAPENEIAEQSAVRRGAEVFDRTSVLGEQSTVPAAPYAEPYAPPAGFRLTINEAGRVREVHLEGRRWIIGRRGSSGRGLPEGYRKIDIDFPATVSREQLRVDVIGNDRLRIERLGKAPVRLANGEELREGENRLLQFGTPFTIGESSLKFEV